MSFFSSIPFNSGLYIHNYIYINAREKKQAEEIFVLCGVNEIEKKTYKISIRRIS